MRSMLPGDFNMACSEIYGGMYQGMFQGNQEWKEGVEGEQSSGIDPELARRVFKFGVAANANDDMFPRYREQLRSRTWRVIRTEDVGFEITEIVFANESALNLYGQQQCAGIKTLGKIKAKTWISPYAEDEDLTEEEEAQWKANPPPSKKYEFWLEEDILHKCSVGMKFEATIRELSFGLTYFDAIQGVRPSFYQLIPNELMGDWKEIEKDWLPMKKNKLATNGESKAEDDDHHDHEHGDNDAAEEAEMSGAAEPGSTGPNTDGDNEQQDQSAVNQNLIGAGYDDDVEKEEEANAETEAADPPTSATDNEDPKVDIKKVGEEVKKVSGNLEPVLHEKIGVNDVSKDK